MRNFRPFLLPVVLLTFCANAQQRSVLFVGNSYTYSNDLPNTFRQLALSLGDTVTVGMSAPGGYTFQQHSTFAPTLDAIASQPWDYVVLQEQSQLPSFPQSQVENEVYPYAIELVDFIEANDECTWPVFFMTWGRENGDASNCATWPPVCTYEGMQELLRERYLAMAFANDGIASPVGVAWQHVRETDPSIQLYSGDGSHPSVNGTYLAACVFYCSLFGEPCTGASYISSLPQETADLLQEIASSTVLDSADVWNLNVPNGTSAQITGSSSEEPGSITYYHPGAGTHVWTSSDGQVHTDANPTFVFTEIGTYTITHDYTDPCGNHDVISWTIEILVVGMEEHEVHDRYKVGTCGPAMVEVVGGTGRERFTIIDAQGRVLLSSTLTADRICLTSPLGPLLWRIRNEAGAVWSGKVMVQ